VRKGLAEATARHRMAYSLLLDDSIRDWVVLPMVVMLILVGMGRHYVQQLIRSDPQITKDAVKELGYKQTLMQAGRFRAWAHILNEDAVAMRRQYFLVSLLPKCFIHIHTKSLSSHRNNVHSVSVLF